MIPHTNTKTIILEPSASSAVSLHDMAWDNSGFDYCTIDVLHGTLTTTTQVFDKIAVYESDTVTVATSMTAIVALSGSQTTDATHGWTIPTLAATSIGGVITLEINLKARKRYMGLFLRGDAANAGAATAHVGAVVKLSRAEDAPTTAAKKDGVNLTNTTMSGCMKLVTDGTNT